ncbi:MAG: thioredoxin family protein [Paludibacteraceae bacterium]|nr:thioredoxin family protein [Paludibacteraceae bacterium]
MKQFLTILLSLLSLSLSAQILEPVHWSLTDTRQTDSVLTVTLTARIDKGWHLYSTSLPEDGPRSTSFSVEGADSLTVALVKGSLQTAYDENFLMDLSYFSSEASWQLSLPLSQIKGDTVRGSVEFMACNDLNCIPPATWDFTAAILTPQSSLHTSQPASSLLWLFLMGLLGGLLAVFTPCVWPIIPMTVSFFMKRNQDGKAVKDALLYGLSIVVIYVALGLLVTLVFGASALNDISTNAIVNIFFFALLVVFALSFFGAFEITLPSSWSTRLDSKARSASGLLSILLMAFTLVIVSFSCTGPIIGTLLVEAAGKSLLAPAVGMLGFAIALALPFSLFAMFPQWMRRLPRSGGWMDSFKVVLAFLELALSLKFFSVADLAYGWHLLDREVFLSLWIVIFLLLGFYLLGFFRFRHEEQPQGISVFRFMLAVISIAFSIYMVPGLWGAPLKAISAFAPPLSTQDWVIGNNHSLSAASDNNLFSHTVGYDDALLEAGRQGKTLLLDFSGYGCVNCRKMEAKVLSDERVQAALANYLVVTLIVDDKTKLPEPVTVEENGKQRRLKTVGDYNSYIQRSRFSANAQPYYVRLSPEGRQMGSAYSYDEDISKFLKWLQ